MWAASTCLIALLGPGMPSNAQEEEFDYASTNLFGGVGLLRTRTARFAPDGQFEIGASFLNPYRNYYLNWQILPWAEVVFRYADITNRPGQISAIPQSTAKFFEDLIKLKNANTFLDRSFDFKFRLLKEGRYVPALALGFQDALGTGIFSGEYLVASKQFGRLDLHMGMGWGVLGSRGGITNPLRLFGNGFKTRPGFSGRGGKFSFNSYFSGPTAGFFGGAEYVTPWEGVTVKFEYNGTDPASVAGEDALDEDLPIGIGINYRPVPWFDFGFGFERGNTVSMRFALRTNFYKLGVRKTGPAQPAIIPRPKKQISDHREVDRAPTLGAGLTLNQFYEKFRQISVSVSSLEFMGPEAHFVLTPEGLAMVSPDLEYEVAKTAFSGLPRTTNEVHIQWVDGAETSAPIVVSRSVLTRVSEIERQLVDQLAEGSNLVAVSLWNAEIKSGSGPNTVPAAEASLRLSDLVTQGLLRQRPKTSHQLLKFASHSIWPTPKAWDGALATPLIEAAYGELISPTSAAALVPLAAQSGALTAEQTKIHAEPMFRELAQHGFGAYSLQIYDTKAVLHLVRAPFREGPINLSWASRIAANHLPFEVEEITIVEILGALEVSRVTLLRSDLERRALGRGSPEEIMAHTEFETPRSDWKEANTGYVRSDVYPAFDWWLAPELQQHIGDPSEGIYLADVDLELGLVYALTPKISLSFVGRRFLFGNLDNIDRKSNSQLPRVRSNIVEYLQNGRTHIEQLQANYISGLAPNWYFRASAGLFEGMFGGVGGEILYKPFDKPFALAVDLNWVKQRDFDQLLSFQDYEVLTGHATLYYDLPFYDMRATISAGRYLAKDRGVTFDFSRRFPSGIRVGAWATFTNVSADQFGEGSFDKGFYVSIPLELLLTRRTQQTASFLFRPLTRDGGQKLGVGPRLFDFFENRNRGDFEREWSRMYD
jgi:hypothetical protein